jgi:hypothetical protein
LVAEEVYEDEDVVCVPCCWLDGVVDGCAAGAAVPRSKNSIAPTIITIRTENEAIRIIRKRFILFHTIDTALDSLERRAGNVGKRSLTARIG